mgnify:CR=1 FL=1
MPVLLHGSARFQQQPKRWQTVANAMANAVDYACATSG